MKVAVRCIYYKAVTPSCDIIDMDDETWSLFLRSDKNTRIEIVLYLLHKEFMKGKVREIAWLPLNNQNKLREAHPAN